MQNHFVTLSADLAVVAFGLAWWLMLAPAQRLDDRKTCVGSNTFYTAGIVLMSIHVLLAYAIAHHWSHQAALAHAAIETQAVIGIDFADGLYANFVFLVVYGVDTLWRWRVVCPHRRSPMRLARVVDAFLIFIVLMATLVFESGPIRWLTIGYLVAISIRIDRARRCLPVSR